MVLSRIDDPQVFEIQIVQGGAHRLGDFRSLAELKFSFRLKIRIDTPNFQVKSWNWLDTMGFFVYIVVNFR